MNDSIRYTPQAMRDMEAVWDGVYAASRNYDIADRYIDEFARDYMTILFGETDDSSEEI